MYALRVGVCVCVHGTLCDCGRLTVYLSAAAYCGGSRDSGIKDGQQHNAVTRIAVGSGRGRVCRCALFSVRVLLGLGHLTCLQPA
jgi:hypothetical protein